MKINQKHNLLVRELSDLINQPSPSSSHHSVDNSRMVIREKVNDRSMQTFESKLAGTLCMCMCIFPPVALATHSLDFGQKGGV